MEVAEKREREGQMEREKRREEEEKGGHWETIYTATH